MKLFLDSIEEIGQLCPLYVIAYIYTTEPRLIRIKSVGEFQYFTVEPFTQQLLAGDFENVSAEAMTIVNERDTGGINEYCQWPTDAGTFPQAVEVITAALASIEFDKVLHVSANDLRMV